MNSKWFYITIVAYRYYTPCFDSHHEESNQTMTLPNLPPENSEMFLISALHKIKNPFSLFRQRAAKFPIEQTLCIDAYRINYVYQKIELQGNIACLWENKILMILEHLQLLVRKTTSKPKRQKKRYCCNVNTRSESQNVENTTL